MLQIECEQYFNDVVEFAKRNDLYDNEKINGALKKRLDYLESYGGDKTKSRTRLFRDSAPYSFGLLLEKKDGEGEWVTLFEGGLIFHGAHDGHGSGAAPTFAVTLTPVTGWSIHT